MENVIKRNVKDSVFTSLFSEPKYLLQLYRSLHPEDDKTTISDLTDVTINNVIVNEQYNDLGFIVNDRLMIMVECQSKWSESIAFRSLLYITETYSRLVTENQINVFDKPPRLPKPELYVIYTGTKKKKIPDRITLDSSFGTKNHRFSSFYVEVISKENAKNIVQEYIQFSNITTDMIKKYGNNEKTLEKIITTCIEFGILKEYLENHSAEVKSIMSHLWCDQKKAVEEFKVQIESKALAKGIAKGMAEGMAKGKAEGMAEGMTEGKAEIVRTMMGNNISPEDISKMTNIPIEQVILLSNN